jgi:hypothetical protein
VNEWAAAVVGDDLGSADTARERSLIAGSVGDAAIFDVVRAVTLEDGQVPLKAGGLGVGEIVRQDVEAGGLGLGSLGGQVKSVEHL